MIINGKEVSKILRNGQSVSEIIRDGETLYKEMHPNIPTVARYSAKGKTNQDGDAVILHDLSGNRHPIILHNFAFCGMSGYGGYNENFNDDTWDSYDLYDSTDASLVIACSRGGSAKLVKQACDSINSMTIRITVSDNIGASYNIRYYYINMNGQRVFMNLYDEGIHELPISYGYESGLGEVGFVIGYLKSAASIKIEQIPAYPGGLVFDGVDDYGAVDGFTLQDYTVICKRKILKDINVAATLAAYNSNNLIFEYYYIPDGYMTYSFGNKHLSHLSPPKEVSWQTANSYNGMEIPEVTVPWLDAYPLNFNVGRVGGWSGYSKMVLYDLIIYDRTLTEKEIQSEIKKYNL